MVNYGWAAELSWYSYIINLLYNIILMLTQQSNLRRPLQIILKTVGIKNADIKTASEITIIFWITRIWNLQYD